MSLSMEVKVTSELIYSLYIVNRSKYDIQGGIYCQSFVLIQNINVTQNFAFMGNLI